MPFRALIVGLGNPGPTHAGNRHNFGFMAARTLLEQGRAHQLGRKGGGELWELKIPRLEGRFLVLMPQTYMNLSGTAVSWALGFYKLDKTKLLVLHDELDLPLGKMQLKLGGGLAGHNGLKSIAGETGTQDFARLRLGIGRPNSPMDISDYVLRDFSHEERVLVAKILPEAANIVHIFFSQGADQAARQAKATNLTPLAGD